MELMTVLLPLAALVSGVLFTWLLMKGRFQGEFADLNAHLAEKAARCDFVDQAHIKIASELAVLDGNTDICRTKIMLWATVFPQPKSRLPIAEKEAESVRLKQSYIELREKAQGLAVENERLATQLGQEREGVCRPICIGTPNPPKNRNRFGRKPPNCPRRAKRPCRCRQPFCRSRKTDCPFAGKRGGSGAVEAVAYRVAGKGTGFGG